MTSGESERDSFILLVVRNWRPRITTHAPDHQDPRHESIDQNVVSMASYLRAKSPSSTSDDEASSKPQSTTRAPRRPRATRAVGHRLRRARGRPCRRYLPRGGLRWLAAGAGGASTDGQVTTASKRPFLALATGGWRLISRRLESRQESTRDRRDPLRVPGDELTRDHARSERSIHDAPMA